MDRDSQTVLAHEFSYVLSLTTHILDDMLCQPPTAKDFVNRHKAAVSVIESDLRDAKCRVGAVKGPRPKKGVVKSTAVEDDDQDGDQDDNVNDESAGESD